MANATANASRLAVLLGAMAAGVVLWREGALGLLLCGLVLEPISMMAAERAEGCEVRQELGRWVD